jgi:hypothetical protein
VSRTRAFAAALRRHAPLLAFLLAVIVYYVFLISAGHMTRWHAWSAFVDAQAEGLRAGHLYLPEAPSKALQELANPYDPANMRYWRWDHTYYRGHLYLYWGMVPAMLLAGVKTLFRLTNVVTDDALAFVFAVGRLIVGTLLLRALAARVVPRPPPWAVWLALLVFALANPMPYTLNRGAAYEVAIVGGALFMLAGLACALKAMFAVDPRAALRWLVAGSVALGLAGGTRVSLLPAIVVLAIVAGLVRWRIDGGGRVPLLRALAAAGAPAAALVVAHFALNYLRFGEWTEFGARYQMGWVIKASPRFAFADAWIYFLGLPSHACKFPFLFAHWKAVHGLMPGWFPWPADHNHNEPSIGLFVVVWFTWLAVAYVPIAIARRLRAATVAAPAAVAPAELWRQRWIWLGPLLYTLGGLAPVLMLFATTMRYELDFSSGLLLLSALAGWRLLALPISRAGRRAVAATYALLATVTIAAGLLLGFGGYFDHFGRHNPTLIRSLEKTLSVCPGPTPTPVPAPGVKQ